MKPILFSTPMVQAILVGRKTQTRRVIKPQPIDSVEVDGNLFHGNYKGYVKVDGHPNWQRQFAHEFAKYQPGDILYVRETWRLVSWNWDDSEATIEFKDGEKVCFELDGDDQYQWLFDQVEKLIRLEIYVATDEDSEQMDWSGKPNPWNPSIHLPIYCSRIFLQVTDVRAERLQDITENDAKAEGAKDVLTVDEMKVMKGSKFVIPRPFLMHQFGFMSIWCKINGVESWDSNPWVWVYTFEKIEKP